ncbi:MAG: sugar ABC transporter ATP-binding protein, partial [Micrococcales bacterium]|nr:sugar ABC transporter ATP-binding protein [Micrococcales bacterium]
ALPRAKVPATIDWKLMNERAAELLTTVGVSADPRRLAGTLPLALQQLLECARALAHRCSVIFFDEPTSPLTSDEVSRLFGLIDQLRSRGLTLGFISHRMDEVEEISDRITVLRDGSVVARETRGSATRAELTDAMVGRAVLMTKREPRATTTETAVLRVTDLASTPKVRGISVQVNAGEIVGLAGLVGSGRTEFCEAVFGLRRIESGTVQVAGKDVTSAPTRARVASGLVYLAEDRGRNGIFADVDLVRNSTAAILDRLPRRLRLMKRVDERVKAYESLVRTTVKAASVDLPIKSLSGGNQQKVLFARWMMATPKVALFDEPTRGVDVGAKQGIYEIIESLADEGVAVLVVSSELEELVRLCDRVYAVYEGKVVGELSGEEIELGTIGRLAVGA